MLCEPVLRLIETRTDAPRVAVLLDDTESMLVSGSQSRGTVDAFLGSAHSASLSPAEIHYYSFAGSITPLGDEPPDSLTLPGQTTNLSAALTGIGSKLREENIRAVVLVSDGNYNEGRNPLNELEELGVPVFTVGVGDTQRQKDLLVDRVYTNTLAYAGSNVPVDVYLRSFGYDGDRVGVTLSEGNEVLARQTVELTAGRTEYPLRFTVPAGTEGTHKYTVSADGLPGEVTDRNNSQSVFLKVLRSRIRVVIFAGTPSPDVAAVGQALREDPQLEVRSFIQKSRGTFIGEAPGRQVLDSADCFVFINFPSVLTGDPTLQAIRTAMTGRKGPLLYVHGKAVDHRKLGTFESFIPFTVSPPNNAEDLVFASVPDPMQDNPLVVDRTGDLTVEAWENLPPVYKLRSAFGAKPGSDVLATARLQNFPLNEPLVLSRSVGGNKSIAVTGHGIYRWRLMAQGSASTRMFFTSFLSNAVRWLTTRENEKQVRVRPAKEIFTTAEEADFRAEVYNEQLFPVDDAEVTVEITDGTRTQAVGLQPVGNGRYEGSFGAVPGGEYTFNATARTAGRSLGTDAGKFTVGGVNVEYLSTRMDSDLLARIARQSGGEFFTPDRADQVWAAVNGGVKLTAREEVLRREIEIWNWGYLGGIVLFLLAGEWFLRKRWALL
jgi:hypothetical protein